MPRYTHARLAYALQVFRETLPYRNKRNLKAANLEQHLKKCPLHAQAITTVSGRPGLWHDKDDSGDYDPTLAKKLQPEPCPKARRPKRAKREIDADDGDFRPRKKAKSRRSWLSGRMLGESLEITLKLTSAAGKALLGKLVDEGVCTLEHNDGCDLGDEKPSLWAQGGGSFSKTPGSSLSSAVRRHSILGPDIDDESDDGDLPSCGLGLRTRTIPAKGTSGGVRKPAKCHHCRLSGSRCGLKKTSTAPCVSCRKAGVECVPGLSDGSDEKKEKVTSGASHNVPPPNTSFCAEAYGITKWIDTNWSHPIDFKFSAARDPTKICHFCRDYRWSILGRGGLKRVEVIVEENGYTYHEMGGGHREDGIEPTNMCIRCALGRFAISRCAKHEFVEVGKTYERKQLLAALVHLFDPNEPTRDPRAANRWCHFCLSPALHACQARQEYDQLGAPIVLGAPVKSGCGLFLCASCVEHVQELGKDRRERLEGAIKQRRMKVRADMEFLFPGSDLHKAYNISS